MTASDNLKFQFATDGEGKYGYLGADDSFIPFKGDIEFVTSGQDDGWAGKSTFTLEKGTYMLQICEVGGTSLNSITPNFTIPDGSYELIKAAGPYRLKVYSYKLTLNSRQTISVTQTVSGGGNGGVLHQVFK